MDIAQLLHLLALAPDVEVVKPFLPDMCIVDVRPQIELRCTALSAHHPGKSLLHDFITIEGSAFSGSEIKK
jgi:hypothetical protein